MGTRPRAHEGRGGRARLQAKEPHGQLGRGRDQRPPHSAGEGPAPLGEAGGDKGTEGGALTALPGDIEADRRGSRARGRGGLQGPAGTVPKEDSVSTTRSSDSGWQDAREGQERVGGASEEKSRMRKRSPHTVGQAGKGPSVSGVGTWPRRRGLTVACRGPRVGRALGGRRVTARRHARQHAARRPPASQGHRVVEATPGGGGTGRGTRG